jgi:predicted nucleic acid-binding protein
VIIADTGPLVALANDQDKYHSTCSALLESHPGPVLVPALIVLEVCQVLASRRGTRSEASFLGSIAAGELRLVELTSADYARCAELVTRYRDLPLGAADASVVAVAERLGIAEVATLDRRHFSVVRPRHVPAFTLLPG